MPKERLYDMVVLLPGITGSVLQKDGRDIWAASPQALGRILTSKGDLTLSDDDPEVDDLGDGIRATRLMPYTYVPGLVKIDGYSHISRLITDNFKVEVGSIHSEKPANFFEFPYDWRRDNRVTARVLKRIIEQKLRQWQQYSGEKDAKVIFLAHSMGGLVARYYLEVMEGWCDCRSLITFGTPYRGSLNALNYLANGYKLALADLTEVMRSCTSVYQLLPIYKVVKVESTYQRVAEINGISGLLQARAQQALAFHREIENAVTRHREDNEYHEHGYKMLPVVGTGQPTAQSAGLVDGRLTVSRELPSGINAWFGDGDGTVPRFSAIPIELSEEYRDTFIAERHSSLQRNDKILKIIRRRLEQMQAARGLREVRGPEIDLGGAAQPAISLDLDDLYVRNEPVEFRAWLLNSSKSVGQLEASIDAIGGDEGTAVKRAFREEKDGWMLRVEGLPAGLYRLTVSTTKAGPKAPRAVHDLFEVAE